MPETGEELFDHILVVLLYLMKFSDAYSMLLILGVAAASGSLVVAKVIDLII